MNYKRLFAIAIVLNLVLLAVVLRIWHSRQPATSEPPPAGQMSPTPVQPEAKPEEKPLTPIQLSPERMQSIGVTFGTVQMRKIAEEIRVTGNVDADERRLAYVQTRFTGWLRNVYVNATYQFVRKGQPLFTIYSPDLVSTEQEYLLARKNQQQLQTSSVEGVSEGADSLVSAARDRLKQWEIRDSEIAKLDATGKPITELTIYSPVAGYVTERMALPNMYVQPETKLYSVADLSSVWVNAQVFQNDIGKVRPGSPADVTVDAYPGKAFKGRVEQILPQVDMNTRTVRVRLVLPNPGLMLKPGMFVNVILKAPMGEKLVVPASAVLQSGTKQIVFIDQGNGTLDPVDLELGPRTQDGYVVLKGSKAGDRVVTSANFLLDSESQLQTAAGGFTPPPPGAGGADATNQSAQAKAELITDPTPPHKGSNTFRVKLTTADGKPLSGAQVNLTFFMSAMPAMGMAEMRVPIKLDDKGNGLYEGRGELGSGGTWQVTITATQSGRTIVTKQLSVTATGGM
jgi:Cu(I)/Ag(I) efflux system membrane fusion protein/cobalt-zinc-cadmium efflux system membrane fusion protein